MGGKSRALQSVVAGHDSLASTGSLNLSLVGSRSHELASRLQELRGSTGERGESIPELLHQLGEQTPTLALTLTLTLSLTSALIPALALALALTLTPSLTLTRRAPAAQRLQGHQARRGPQAGGGAGGRRCRRRP